MCYKGYHKIHKQVITLVYQIVMPIVGLIRAVGGFMMLIDRYLPQYDVTERHRLRIRAPVNRVWESLRTCHLAESWATRLLFAIRRLGRLGSGGQAAIRQSVTLESALRGGFLLLADEPPRELVLGLVGRFWRFWQADLVTGIDADGYIRFARPGYAKAAMNFSLTPLAGRETLLETETRTLCTDTAARRRFLPYWFVIRPFSGLIRMQMLGAVRRHAERRRY
jgi:hypothetical protein